MRITKTVTIPASELVREVEAKCELCGANGKPSCGIGENEWPGIDPSFVAETEIQCKEGRRWPEGGRITHVALDICVDCFNNKLVPWFKSQGGAVREVEVDF